MLQPQNWTSLSGHRSSAKAGATHLWGNTRNDRTEYNLVGSSNNSDETQPHNVRMGELLLSWTGQYSLSRCRWLRDDEAASMVANEAQALRTCKRDVPGYTSLWSLGSCSSGQTDTQLSVGESVSLLREPDAGDPPVRFDERDVETEQGEPSEAPADERAGNR